MVVLIIYWQYLLPLNLFCMSSWSSFCKCLSLSSCLIVAMVSFIFFMRLFFSFSQVLYSTRAPPLHVSFSLLEILTGCMSDPWKPQAWNMIIYSFLSQHVHYYYELNVIILWKYDYIRPASHCVSCWFLFADFEGVALTCKGYSDQNQGYKLLLKIGRAHVWTPVTL